MSRGSRVAGHRFRNAPRRLPVVTAALVTALVMATGLAAAGGGQTVPGRHDDHGRFSARAEGFPPQPVDLAGQASVAVTPRSQAAANGALRTALADVEVRRALGADPRLVGVEEVSDKSGGAPPAFRVTWYAPHDDHSVTTVVQGAGVVSVDRTPAAEWQPPLTAAEVDDAIAIARAHFVEAGRSGMAQLEGFAMAPMDPDGSFPATRMAYVTFHAHVDARPQLLTWVDLSTGTVTDSRTAPADPSPASASHGTDTFAGPSGPEVPRSGSVDWNGWSLDYDVSGRMDGVSLNDVTYHGTMVLARASMPAMTVFYDQDVCGPFVDRLGGDLTPVDWAGGQEVVLREFQQHGAAWLEIGILDTIGNYVLYQAFYLGTRGQLDVHTFAKGIQCPNDHLHYPFWRLDFDLAGAEGDRITRRTPDGAEEVMTTEFDASAADAADHGWVVHDIRTGHRVLVDFDDGTWNVPGQVVPETVYEQNRVYGRRYSDADAGPWPGVRAVTELGGNEGRHLDGEDLVMWYRGFLPHADSEGPDLWHSTGVRLTVELQRTHYIRPR
ncbi:MAG TPA: hypothetical protein VMM13_14625 [Euzebya sp.]|nr:hypothetical protein [Euzebya sp.]